MRFYSPSTGGFYCRDVNGNDIPSDAVSMTDEQYAALRLALSNGKIIAIDGSLPVAVDPPEHAPVVPSSISPAQARIALHNAGLLNQVEAAVAAADIVTQIAWAQATAIERASPTVSALSAALSLTDEQLDDLFTAAAAIRV